ncbi:unnamed protein product [Vicia faba]|uniref:RNase H type-1 domain-containing protein n=1 Tax=Vicia faba TaxID=3906 RepID=A0AAV0ZTF6_VICFA|nr:unnamed protein product [Vicia faba]
MNPKNQPVYVLRFCGVSDENPGPAGAAAILLGEDRTVLYRFRWGLGNQTAIAAEYHALILGMKQAIIKGYKNIIAEGDSGRVINQVKGFEYAHEPIRRLWVAVLELKHSFHAFHIHLIPRLENSLADAQAKQAANLQESEVQEDDLVA